MMNLNKTTVRKLLKTVDAGLCSGLGEPQPGKMCVEAAVCYALGLPHGDEPECVGEAVRKLAIKLNDGNWSSYAARAAGLRKLAVAQLGSNTLDQNRFSELVALKTVQRLCPLLFAELAKLAKTDEDREVMESAGRACAEVTSLQEAATVLSRAYDHARDLDLGFAHGLSLALSCVIDHTLDLSYNVAFDLSYDVALDRTLDLSYNVAFDLALARDETLTMLADLYLEVLVEMDSPGCQWLWLCENQKNQ